MSELYQSSSDKEFMDKYNKILNLFYETREQFQKTQRQIEEITVLSKANMQKIDKLYKSLEYLNNFVSNASETIETLFYKALNRELDENDVVRINGLEFYTALRNVRIGSKKQRKEVDIVLMNSSERLLAIIEVKIKLHKNDIDQLERVKKFINKDRGYKEYNIIFGFAAVNIPEDVKQAVLDRGFFLVEFDVESKSKRFILPEKLQVYNSRKERSFWTAIKSLLSL